MKQKVLLIFLSFFILYCGPKKQEINYGVETRDVVLASGKEELGQFYQEFIQKIIDKYYSPFYNNQVDIFALDFRDEKGNTTILSKLLSDFLSKNIATKKELREVSKQHKDKAYDYLHLAHIDLISNDLSTTLVTEYGAEVIIDGEVMLEKADVERVLELNVRAYETKSGIKILGLEKRFNFDRIVQTMDLENYLQTVLIKKESLKTGHLKISHETKLGQLNDKPLSSEANAEQKKFESLYINEQKMLDMKIESRISLDNLELLPNEEGVFINRSLKSGPYELGIMFTITFPSDNNLIYKKKEARYLIEVPSGEELEVLIENLIEQPEPHILVKAIATKSISGKEGKTLMKEFVTLKELPVHAKQ